MSISGRTRFGTHSTSYRWENGALDKLEIYAVEHNSAFAGWLWNRGFDPLRDKPRFKAVLAKLAIPYTPPAVTEP